MADQDSALSLLRRADQPSTVNLLAIGATRPLLQHLIPQFEAATGHKVNAWFGPPALIEEKLLSQESVDVVFTFEPKWSELIAAGFLEPGDELARVGIGLAVQKGAAKPDLSTEASTKSFLLGARLIAGAGFNDGSVGSWVLRSLHQMGIAETVLPKYRVYRTGVEMIAAVARREADAVLSVMPDLADDPTIDYVGPFPPTIQQYEIARGTVAAQSTVKPIGRALIAFAKHPAHAALRAEKWLYGVR